MSKKSEPKGNHDLSQKLDILINDMTTMIGKLENKTINTNKRQKTIQSDVKKIKDQMIEIVQGLKQLDDWCKNLELRIVELEVK